MVVNCFRDKSTDQFKSQVFTDASRDKRVTVHYEKIVLWIGMPPSKAEVIVTLPRICGVENVMRLVK